MYEYRGTIARVIDIDTFDVIFDLGFNISHLHRVRLIGVDGYESKHIRGNTDEEVAKGIIGKNYIQKWLTGRNVRVATSKDSSDKYGRYLAEFLIMEDGQQININQWIIENNYGVPTNDKGAKSQEE